MCNVHDRVCKVLSQALNAEADEITSDKRIVADLGAASIDFLDITFRLEREFNIRITSGELFPDTEKTTFEGSVNDLAETLTVQSLVNYINAKVNQ